MADKIITLSYIYDKGIFRPQIQVQILDNRSISWPFEAIVDSGSDENILPTRIGEQVGLKFDQNSSKVIYGIDGSRIKAFPQKVTLHLYSLEFTTVVNFSYEQKLALLGRNGFFNLFKSIKFREKELFLDIEL